MTERRLNARTMYELQYSYSDNYLSNEELLQLAATKAMLCDLNGIPLTAPDFSGIKMIAKIIPVNGITAFFYAIDPTSIKVEEETELSREDFEAINFTNGTYLDNLFRKGTSIKFQRFNIGKYNLAAGESYLPYHADMRMDVERTGIYQTTFLEWKYGDIRVDFNTFDIIGDLVFGFTEIPRQFRELYKRWVKQGGRSLTVSNMVVNS